MQPANEGTCQYAPFITGELVRSSGRYAGLICSRMAGSLYIAFFLLGVSLFKLPEIWDQPPKALAACRFVRAFLVLARRGFWLGRFDDEVLDVYHDLQVGQPVPLRLYLQ